ncbi:MAG: hypothetical protein J6R83_03320 [Clostridia bacterium]|nr:hypothetical protein [Clostridia bacterium]
MSRMYEDLECLSIGEFVGVNPEKWQQAAEAGQKIQQVGQSGISLAAKTTALGNQTGGNVMGFTYE